VPTQGTLGRAAMPGPPTLDAVREQAGTYIEAAYTITVERAQVNRLRETIDARHRQSIHTAVASSWSDLVFVHDPKRYTMFYNSNHRTAEWLEALGCEVRGWPVLSNWEVREAEGR